MPPDSRTAPAAVKPALQDLALERRALALEHARASRASASGPGCTSASQSSAPGTPSTSRPVPISRHSTAPPLGTRRPMSRAGKTRVSFTTSRSPARRKLGDAAERRVRRWRRTRDRARAGGWRRAAPAPARSAPRGSSKSKSETFTRASPKNFARGWSGPSRARIGFHRSPSSSRRSRTLSTRKSSMSAPASTSSHVSGIDTVAFGRGRTE